MKYGMDKRLRPRREQPYQVSPYGLCFSNGNYYLICRYQGSENISHYRVDRIQSPDMLSDILDRFGMETQLHNNGDGTFDAAVFTGTAGLQFWALQYVTVCQVLEPLWPRQKIGDILRTGWENYQQPPPTK